jgi:hypothetical protein
MARSPRSSTTCGHSAPRGGEPLVERSVGMPAGGGVAAPSLRHAEVAAGDAAACGRGSVDGPIADHEAVESRAGEHLRCIQAAPREHAAPAGRLAPGGPRHPLRRLTVHGRLSLWHVTTSTAHSRRACDHRDTRQDGDFDKNLTRRPPIRGVPDRRTDHVRCVAPSRRARRAHPGMTACRSQPAPRHLEGHPWRRRTSVPAVGDGTWRT